MKFTVSVGLPVVIVSWHILERPERQPLCWYYYRVTNTTAALSARPMIRVSKENATLIKCCQKQRVNYFLYSWGWLYQIGFSDYSTEKVWNPTTDYLQISNQNKSEIGRCCPRNKGKHNYLLNITTLQINGRLSNPYHQQR